MSSCKTQQEALGRLSAHLGQSVVFVCPRETRSPSRPSQGLSLAHMHGEWRDCMAAVFCGLVTGQQEGFLHELNPRARARVGENVQLKCLFHSGEAGGDSRINGGPLSVPRTWMFQTASGQDG